MLSFFFYMYKLYKIITQTSLKIYKQNFYFISRNKNIKKYYLFRIIK